MDARLAAELTEFAVDFHVALVKEIKKSIGRSPRAYKRLEPYKIQSFFESRNLSSSSLIGFGTDMLSVLLRAHPFPNANHRTLLFLTGAFFQANGLRFPHYRGRIPNWETRFKSDCNSYIYGSKYWLKLRYQRDVWQERFESGQRFMYFRTGKRKLREEDLKLNKTEMANRHLALTREWLERMLEDQSARDRRMSADSLRKLMTQ